MSAIAHIRVPARLYPFVMELKYVCEFEHLRGATLKISLVFALCSQNATDNKLIHGVPPGLLNCTWFSDVLKVWDRFYIGVILTGEFNL